MDNIQQELEFLAAQAGSHKDQHTQIQKLSPAQMAVLASGLGRKHGVKIEFGDFSTAATDGKTISLPLTSKENSWIVRGYVDHEAAHVRMTDFALIPWQSVFHRSLWNILEDIRIEAYMPMLYPGMASNYRALIRELRNTTPGFFEIGQGAPPESIIATYISLMLRSMYLKQVEVADLAINARQVFVDTFGAQLERDLFSEIITISDVNSPKDVLDMVEKIIRVLAWHAEEQPQGNAGPDDEPDKNPDAASDGASGAAQVQAQGDEDDPAQGDASQDENQGTPEDFDIERTAGPQDSDSAGTGDDGQGQTSDNDNLQGTGDNPQAETGSDAKARILEALASDDEIGDLGKQLQDLTWAKETNTDPNTYEIARPVNNADLVATGYKPYPVKASSAVVARLSSRLRGLLQAQDLQHGKPGMAGNRIARNRLHRIKTGEPRLFLKKHPQAQVNTAVQILIDNSTSMSENDRFYKAREVVIALTKTLGTLRGINLGMTVFPAFYPYSIRNGHSIPVATILQHGRRPGSEILYPPEPKGQTPLAPAVRYTASQMLGLQEPRKILLILTDGDPDSGEDARIAIQEAGSLGIQVVCLGIEGLVYTQIFPHFQIVNNVQELPEKTFRLLEFLLTASKP